MGPAAPFHGGQGDCSSCTFFYRRIQCPSTSIFPHKPETTAIALSWSFPVQQTVHWVWASYQQRILGGDLSYLHQPRKQFKTTVGNEGRVEGKMGDAPPSHWLLLSTTVNFSLYSGPGLCEQNQESSVSQETGINTERGSYGNQEAELPVKKVCSQARVCVCFLQTFLTHWPYNIHQHSPPQPYSHRLMVPGRGNTSLRTAEHPCLGLTATRKVESCMEHCVNSKSWCHKKQLQSFKSGLSFMRQRRREETGWC